MIRVGLADMLLRLTLVENAIASGVERSGRVDGSPRTPCFLSIPRLRARLLQKD